MYEKPLPGLNNNATLIELADYIFKDIGEANLARTGFDKVRRTGADALVIQL